MRDFWIIFITLCLALGAKRFLEHLWWKFAMGWIIRHSTKPYNVIVDKVRVPSDIILDVSWALIITWLFAGMIPWRIFGTIGCGR